MVRHQIPRYVVEILQDGNDEAIAKAAITHALTNSLSRTPNGLVFVTNTKDLPSWLVAMLGEDVVKTIRKQGSAQTKSGTTLQLASKRTLHHNVDYGVVFGVQLDKEGIDAIDSVETATAIYLLPWLVAEGKAWAQAWRASNTGQANWNLTWASLPAAVEAELSKHSVRNLLHNNDQKAVRESFKSLKKQGHFVDPELVRGWALRRGWLPKDADELMKEAGK